MTDDQVIIIITAAAIVGGLSIALAMNIYAIRKHRKEREVERQLLKSYQYAERETIEERAIACYLYANPLKVGKAKAAVRAAIVAYHFYGYVALHNNITDRFEVFDLAEERFIKYYGKYAFTKLVKLALPFTDSLPVNMRDDLHSLECIISDLVRALDALKTCKGDIPPGLKLRRERW